MTGPAKPSPGEVRFFSAASWRQWLAENGETASQVWVGFTKRGADPYAMTWPQAVDQALCFGWIDGVRRRIDDARYCIRFTPRRERSVWSAVNVARAGELTAEGLMRPAGLLAFARRDQSRTDQYSYERAHAELDPDQLAAFRAEEAAWSFFQAQPPSYRRTATWWVLSAKRADTRRRRLAILIADSAGGRRLAATQGNR